ncbi:MAG: tRNA lysidine(34) synthetase TilS [Bacteroidota bacterium]
MKEQTKRRASVTEQFLRRLKRFCSDHHLIAPDDKILVAVSGGKDSTALLEALWCLRHEYRLRLAIVHCNHQLRGRESNQDAAFVRRLAGQYELDYYEERLRTKECAVREKLSIEEAARNLRYQFFHKLLQSSEFEKVATAHTANDNAETVLLHLFRGTGVAGLAGIPAHRRDVNVIRPLLFATRKDVNAYARAAKLKHREDSSNRQQSFRRNYVRRTLLPAISRNFNENIVGTLNRTAELFSHLSDYLKAQAQDNLLSLVRSTAEDRIVLDISGLRSYLYFVRENAVLLALRSLTTREADFEKVRSILDLTEARTGLQIDVFKDVVAYRDRDVLVLERRNARRRFDYEVTIERAYCFPEFEFHSSLVPRSKMTFGADRSVAFVDAEKLEDTLLLRSWRSGDWFIPIGMRGKKKLSDFFVDEKVARYDKYHIPVLESAGSIVWVCGKRLDDRFKVTGTTERILKLSFAYRDM